MRLPAGESNRYHPGRMVRSQIGSSPAAPNDKWWLALRWGSLAMTMWAFSLQGSKSSLRTSSLFEDFSSSLGVSVVVEVDLQLKVDKNWKNIDENQKSIKPSCACKVINNFGIFHYFFLRAFEATLQIQKLCEDSAFSNTMSRCFLNASFDAYFRITLR